MKHDRQKCLYCGKKLNNREWVYGACTECLKLKGKRKGWRPHSNESGMWLYADMAPRMVEYVDPHDMDDRGAMLIYRIVNRGTGVFTPAPDYDKMPAWNEEQPKKPGPPKGLKPCSRCGKLIPAAGYSKCDRCRKISADSTAKWRSRLAKEHKCTHCGKPLPADYKFKNCTDCRALYRAQKEKRKGAIV